VSWGGLSFAFLPRVDFVEQLLRSHCHFGTQATAADIVVTKVTVVLASVALDVIVVLAEVAVPAVVELAIAVVLVACVEPVGIVLATEDPSVEAAFGHAWVKSENVGFVTGFERAAVAAVEIVGTVLVVETQS